MSDDLTQTFRCDHLLIVGVGLIGGAIAQHARRTGAARTITGLGRNPQRLQAAVEAGVIDQFICAPQELNRADLPPCDLAIVCTPVDRVVADVRSLAELPVPPALITDAGSVKQSICDQLCDLPSFIGSHPLAGSEKNGFEHAATVSFDSKLCVLTPDCSTPPVTVHSVEAFWQAIGMRTTLMESDRHDAILARTSHFPHIAAFALANLLQPGDETCVAGGFRDTTRIAASEAELWTAISMANRDAVLAAIEAFNENLAAITQALQASDAATLQRLLQRGQRLRQSLDS